jgi:tetratricopeptide (TPR) repeat protein
MILKPRIRFPLFRMLLLLGAALFTWNACSPRVEPVPESDERAFRRGKSLLREGRRDEALAAFMAVIDSRQDAAESHLEAGLLFLNHLKDPIPAIYHFQRYLGLKPGAEESDLVRELVTTAKKEFARSLPGEPFAPQVERHDLLRRLEELQKENLELRQQLVNLNARLQNSEAALHEARGVALQQRREPAPGQIAPIVIESGRAGATGAADSRTQARSYTVQAGDTLSRISQQMYGTSGRWAEIFEANRDQLPSPNALRPGQVLRIP